LRQRCIDKLIKNSRPESINTLIDIRITEFINSFPRMEQELILTPSYTGILLKDC